MKTRRPPSAAARRTVSAEIAYSLLSGCVGDDAWLTGRNVAHHGRRGERWVERFPGAAEPHSAVLVVQQVDAAFARRDVAAALALSAPEVEFLQSSEVPWGGHYRARGRDGGPGAYFTVNWRLPVVTFAPHIETTEYHS